LRKSLARHGVQIFRRVEEQSGLKAAAGAGRVNEAMNPAALERSPVYRTRRDPAFGALNEK
jgi:hypothetical protein